MYAGRVERADDTAIDNHKHFKPMETTLRVVLAAFVTLLEAAVAAYTLYKQIRDIWCPPIPPAPPTVHPLHALLGDLPMTELRSACKALGRAPGRSKLTACAALAA